MENNMHGDEVEIDLREIFYALKKRAFLILAVALLCGCLSCVYTKFFMTPIYTSTSSMLVLTKETTLSSLADLQIGSQLTKDYTCLLYTSPADLRFIMQTALWQGIWQSIWNRSLTMPL